MEQGTRVQLVERYKEGTRVFAEALEGITDGELDARPGPEEWTAREVVHHMADSEMTSAIRLRRLIAEDAPTIQGYDQEEFAQRLFYGERPIEASVEAVDAARRTTAEILDRLDEGQWARAGTHTESGPYDVEAWLDIYAAHAHDHADQIRRARASAHRR
jgi:DinB superfamily